MAMMVLSDGLDWWIRSAPYLPHICEKGKFTVPDFIENVITLTPQERLPLSVH
jgi:hypothetical protein